MPRFRRRRRPPPLCFLSRPPPLRGAAVQSRSSACAVGAGSAFKLELPGSWRPESEGTFVLLSSGACQGPSH